MITIARQDQLELLEQQLEHARVLVPSITRIHAAAACSPVYRFCGRIYVAGAFMEPHSKELDVHGLHQGFLLSPKPRRADRGERRGAID